MKKLIKKFQEGDSVPRHVRVPEYEYTMQEKDRQTIDRAKEMWGDKRFVAYQGLDNYESQQSAITNAYNILNSVSDPDEARYYIRMYAKQYGDEYNFDISDLDDIETMRDKVQKFEGSYNNTVHSKVNKTYNIYNRSGKPKLINSNKIRDYLEKLKWERAKMKAYSGAEADEEHVRPFYNDGEIFIGSGAGERTFIDDYIAELSHAFQFGNDDPDLEGIQGIPNEDFDENYDDTYDIKYSKEDIAHNGIEKHLKQFILGQLSYDEFKQKLIEYLNE